MDDIIRKCRPYTMLSDERLKNNIESVIHVNTCKIPGDIVEIGVWRGGSMMGMMEIHEQMEQPLFREFHLYDTFTGMTAATEVDKDTTGTHANEVIRINPSVNCESSLEEVKSYVLLNRQISSESIKFHVGDICKTDITTIPNRIAVLRLDTDWYESTKFELDNFYDRVSEGGIIIIDDYGHWQGSRKAVDEFLSKHPYIILKKIDYTGVYFIKPYDTRENMISSLVPKGGRLAEIGVFKGEFAKTLTSLMQPYELILFDLFTGYMGSGNVDGNNMSFCILDEEFQKLSEWAPPFVKLVKGDSSSNLDKFPDNYFDMIYIDGDHGYDGAKKDIEVAFKKIKPNGYIMGHDYEMNMDKAKTFYQFGVNAAVNHFCEKYKQTIFAKGRDGCVSYAIRINK